MRTAFSGLLGALLIATGLGSFTTAQADKAPAPAQAPQAAPAQTPTPPPAQHRRHHRHHRHHKAVAQPKH